MPTHELPRRALTIALLSSLPLVSLSGPAMATVTKKVATKVAAAPQVKTQDSQPDKQTTKLNAVVVSAVPGGQNLNALIRPVAVLSGIQLDNDKAGTLGETVAHIPGVQTTSLGQAVGRPVIRGLGGPRVAITENGLGSGDVSNVSQDHAVTIEPFLADQIEVLKGPATLLYGSGAIGGVVNAVDGRIPKSAPYDGFSGRAEVRYDSVSEGHTGMFRIDAGNDSFAMHADAVRRHDGNYESPDGTLPNSYVRTNSGALGASVLGDWGYVGASVSRYLDTYGSPAEPGDPITGEAPIHIGMAQTRFNIKGSFNHPFAGMRKLEFNAGHTDYAHTEYAGNVANTTFTNKSNEARLLLTHEPLGGWKGTFGVQYLHRKFAALGDESFVPPTTTTGVGVFVTEQHTWGPLRLDVGARVDNQSSQPINGVTSRFHPKSLSVGLGWTFTDAWRLTLGLDHSQRAPAEEELFANGPHAASATYEIGSPDLNVETANQVELGLHYQASWVDAKVSIYDNHYKDFIYLADTGLSKDDLPVRTWSQRDAHFRGGEIEATFHLSNTPAGHWDLRVFGDTVRATLADGGGNVPRIPAARIGTELMWNRDNWRASLGGTHYFRQDKTAAFETETAGFTLINAHLGWTFRSTGTSQWEAFLDASNLANQSARMATSLFKDYSPLPGRRVSIGVRAWL